MNFRVLAQLECQDVQWSKRFRSVCYACLDNSIARYSKEIHSTGSNTCDHLEIVALNFMATYTSIPLLGVDSDDRILASCR